VPLVRPLPKIPGEDIAGVVADAGGSTKFKVGDKVAAMMPILGSRWGAYAEYAAIDEEFVALIPAKFLPADSTIKDSDGVAAEFIAAASLPLVALTTVQAFDKLSAILPLDGKKVLVHAGAGGVGSFAIQYAKTLGMRVVSHGKGRLRPYAYYYRMRTTTESTELPPKTSPISQ
jgi:alcohol dehydrogenase